MQTVWSGKNVLIIGAARQGLALARYFVRHGAAVVINDKRSQDQLSSEMKDAANLPIEWVLGNHSPTILERRPDLVCVSGGIPIQNPIVVAAIEENIPLTNDTEIFLKAAPCKTIGITGSAGKTTTTSLVGRIAKYDTENNYRKIWVGGNIGDPLLNYVDEMDPDDLAILEISSFQSELISVSPNIGVILNITPNHLDRHGKMENYIAAKSRVIRFQNSKDIAVLGRDDPNSWALSEGIPSHLFSFGFSPLQKGQDGSFVEEGKFYFSQNNKITAIPVEKHIELRGNHNRLNALAACTIAYVAGFGIEAMIAGISGFQGVLHRLEFVRHWHGTDWFNDSIATAPERTIAAIRSFDQPLILLLGGRDKNLPWQDLAELIHERVDHVIIFGEAGDKIESAIGITNSGRRPFSINRVKKCQDAVNYAAQLANEGFVVLFSPGGTSYDEFKDFEERGDMFKKWVLEF